MAECANCLQDEDDVVCGKCSGAQDLREEIEKLKAENKRLRRDLDTAGKHAQRLMTELDDERRSAKATEKG